MSCAAPAVDRSIRDVAMTSLDPLAPTPIELALAAKSIQYIAESIRWRLADGVSVKDLMAEFHQLSLQSRRLHRDAQRCAANRIEERLRA